MRKKIDHRLSNGFHRDHILKVGFDFIVRPYVKMFVLQLTYVLNQCLFPHSRTTTQNNTGWIRLNRLEHRLNDRFGSVKERFGGSFGDGVGDGDLDWDWHGNGDWDGYGYRGLFRDCRDCRFFGRNSRCILHLYICQHWLVKVHAFLVFNWGGFMGLCRWKKWQLGQLL